MRQTLPYILRRHFCPLLTVFQCAFSAFFPMSLTLGLTVKNFLRQSFVMTSYPLRTKRYKISLAEDQLKHKLTHSFAALVSFRAGLQGEKVILVLGLP